MAVYQRVISFSEILSRNSQDYWVGTVSFKTLRILNCEACAILFSQSWTTVLSDNLTAKRISAVFGVSEAFLYSWLNTSSLIFAWKNYWVYCDVFPRQDNCGWGGAMIVYERWLAVLRATRSFYLLSVLTDNYL